MDDVGQSYFISSSLVWRSNYYRQRKDNIRGVQKVGALYGAQAECEISSPILRYPRTYAAAQPRDLRKIDSRTPNLVPTILARKEAILVCILAFRGHRT